MSDQAGTIVEPGTQPWEAIADGEYAIVELFGHTTLVGRIAEVERFGAKMMALEPLFNGTLLDPVYHGGAAIYRLIPCSRQIAWDKQPRQVWQLPASIKCVVPAAALPPPEAAPSSAGDIDDHLIDDDDISF